jgi:hypothetical protein
MNRAVWVVALNAIMQTTATAEGGFSFAPGAFDQLSPPIHESDVRTSLLICLWIVAVHFTPVHIAHTVLGAAKPSSDES